MDKKLTVADISKIIQSKNVSEDLADNKCMCSGQLDDFTVKKASNGKSYLSMSFTENSSKILAQYFFDENAYNPADLKVNESYLLEGVLKASDNGNVYYTLLACPKLIIPHRTSDDCLLYPIFATEIAQEPSEVIFYPILYKDLYIDNEDEARSKLEDIERNNSEKSANEKKDVKVDLAYRLSDMLEKEGISVQDNAQKRMLLLFALAEKYLSIDEYSPEKTSEYIKMLQMKLRFNLMLQAEKSVVEEKDVDALVIELFGDDIRKDNVSASDAKGKPVASDTVNVSEKTDSSKETLQEKPIRNTSETQTDKNDSHDMGRMKYYVYSLVSFAGNREDATKKLKKDCYIIEDEVAKIFNALALGQEYKLEEVVEKKDFAYLRKKYEDMGFAISEREESVPFTKSLLVMYKQQIVPRTGKNIDFKFINMVDNQLSKDETITYMEEIRIYKTDKIKKNKKGAVKIPFLDTASYSYAIYTNLKIIYMRCYAKKVDYVLHKSDILAINNVYDKKFLTSGQIQFELADGSVLLHQTNFYSDQEKKFNEYAKLIDSLVQQLQ